MQYNAQETIKNPTCVAMFMSLSFETELKTGKFSTAMLDIRYKEWKMRTGHILRQVGSYFETAPVGKCRCRFHTHPRWPI